MQKSKIFYLSSEIEPFSKSYDLSLFSRRFTTNLHQAYNLDLRLSQPKYGFISERKYILREVIRLKDMPIDFQEKTILTNMKSAFIPDSKVQVYFLECDDYFKDISYLIYKSKNGRSYSNNQEKFAYFSKSVLSSLNSLFWSPEYIICNDWQTSYVPAILKHFYKNDPFFENIKTIFFVHSLNEESLLDPKLLDEFNLKGKFSSALEMAFSNSDAIILFQSNNNLFEQLKKKKKLYKIFKSKPSTVIDVSLEIDFDWSDCFAKIESVIEKT
tara:strand:+ start:480 stop:1292 length:813 start_codon:yes stop_codon:yes gene_type:complete